MNRDQASTKVRVKAIEIISKSRRPMTTREIENCIREKDKELSRIISKKCKDYVRIILSVTHGDFISKYKCINSISGIDKRSVFYGLSNKKYNSHQWSLIPNIPKENKKTKQKVNIDNSSSNEAPKEIKNDKQTDIYNLNTLFNENELLKDKLNMCDWFDTFFEDL